MIVNKKGNVSITLLVIGIFAVCSLAILTFLMTGSKVSGSFDSVGAMNELNSEINKYSFFEGQGVSKDKLNSLFDIRLNEFGEEVLFIEKKDTRWKLSAKKFNEEYVLFSAEYVLP